MIFIFLGWLVLFSQAQILGQHKLQQLLQELDAVLRDGLVVQLRGIVLILPLWYRTLALWESQQPADGRPAHAVEAEVERQSAEGQAPVRIGSQEAAY